MSNRLDLDQDRHPVGPDLGLNYLCYQKLPLAGQGKSYCNDYVFEIPDWSSGEKPMIFIASIVRRNSVASSTPATGM